MHVSSLRQQGRSLIHVFFVIDSVLVQTKKAIHRLAEANTFSFRYEDDDPYQGNEGKTGIDGIRDPTKGGQQERRDAGYHYLEQPLYARSDGAALCIQMQWKDFRTDVPAERAEAKAECHSEDVDHQDGDYSSYVEGCYGQVRRLCMRQVHFSDIVC